MHGISAHSAVAIKRQRRRRENARRKHPPTQAERQQANLSNKVMGTITMFHVGAVFLTVGLFLMLAAVITNETNRAEIAELIGTGVVCLVIGLFLVTLNRFYGQREEEELQNYVETRLARTRSGQRLYHESDSYPEQLDDNCRTPSVDSGLSNDFPSSKKNKNKKAGIKGPKSAGSSLRVNQNVPGTHSPGPPPPTSTVNIINEHNHHHSPQPSQHHHHHHSKGNSRTGSTGGVDEISSSGVGLDRISEEDSRTRQHTSYYINDDPMGSSKGGGNFYRVYDATA